MSARVLTADAAVWRPSNLMGVENTDLAKQLGATTLGAVVLEGTGRMRVGDEPAITLAPHSAVLVEPGTVRQVFNDTDGDALWLVVGAPPEALDPSSLSEADIAFMYPDGPKALPPELAAGAPHSKP